MEGVEVFQGGHEDLLGGNECRSGVLMCGGSKRLGCDPVVGIPGGEVVGVLGAVEGGGGG